MVLPQFLFSQIELPVVSHNMDSMNFVDFAKIIEQNHTVRIYFNPDWVDTLIVKQLSKPAPIDSILARSFKGSPLTYLVYDSTKIIIAFNYNFVAQLNDSSLMPLKSKTSLADNSAYESSFPEFVEESTNSENENVVIGNPALKNTGSKAVIQGIISERENGEPIIGAVFYVAGLEAGTSTNIFGAYTIALPKGSHKILIKSIGKKEQNLNVTLYADGKLNISMEEDVVLLKDITVSGVREQNVRGLEVGLETLDIKTIKQIPSTMGEADIIKTALLLPGVQSMGEGAAGFNVRGGAVDQNLVLIDNSPIYNSSHLFGFFSAINSDIVKGFNLYKSSFPANYGGRLSSILDIKVKNGNKKNYSVSAGISPITGKLAVEGPFIKDKASFLFSARSTYSDWILHRIQSPEMQNSDASFYDLNGKICIDFNNNNALYISGYHSDDFFRLNSDTVYSYNNTSGNFLWKHSFTSKLYSTLSGIYSEYAYHVESNADMHYNFNLDYNIKHKETKVEFVFQPNNQHIFKWGGNAILYTIKPGSLLPSSDSSYIIPKQLLQEQGLEASYYINDEYTLNDKISLSAGLRYATFYSLGESTVYNYNPDLPKSINTRTDSSQFSSGEVAYRYGFPEIRLSVRFGLTPNSAIKASYSNMNQFIHMLTNTQSVSPTDSWTLSNKNLKPQRGTQFSLGYYQNFMDDKIEASLETYFKKIENMPEYKPGADLLLNPDLEIDLLEGQGRAYGLEFMLEKKSGKFNGWLSYTYARSLVKVDGKFQEEKINGGSYYPTNYDKPHNIAWVSNYKYSRRISFSATVIYNTGRPITYPVAKYMYRGRELLHYSNRNEYRIPDYFRIDAAINIEGNLKVNKLAHSYWSFSVYNLTGRNNVYSVYFTSNEKSSLKGYKLSIFAQPVPTISYNLKF